MLHELYRHVRAVTERLAAPLCPEDQTVQTMPDVSPTKWHLAHTSWFFETFLLRPHRPAYRPLDERYATLFNSYYVAAGDRHARPDRGHLSRPTVAEVLAYRRHVDAHMPPLLDDPAHAAIVELGINHEEQHQELILTDIKHVLGTNPLHPPYLIAETPDVAVAVDVNVNGAFRPHPGGLVDIGHAGDRFAFDNERPRHPVFLPPFSLSTRLVTNADWNAFILDGGYRRPELWLSDGWDARCAGNWTAPLYWEPGDSIFTLHGLRPRDPAEPVCHVSHYEADAFARWAGARLPLEEELELVGPPTGNLLETGALHPRAQGGGVWQWTGSPYRPYPGFAPFAGVLGEYNGKFMSNRVVLRGGSCFTPRRHLRPSYRNFFPPDARWQMSGLRLARDG